MKAYLREWNGERPDDERRIHCLRLAPNAPEQNPMEDGWLAAKQPVRKLWQKLNVFTEVKTYFTTFIACTIVQFEKLNWDGRLQLI